MLTLPLIFIDVLFFIIPMMLIEMATEFSGRGQITLHWALPTDRWFAWCRNFTALAGILT
jgi:hypothetical protein